MKQKKLILKKTTIANLNQEDMKRIKGGFDLESYVSCPCNQKTAANC